MKTMRFIKTCALVMVLAVGACKKGDNNSDTQAISTDDAASIMATSVASNSGGMAGASVDITANAQIAFNANPGCGGTKTYSFTRQSPAGASVTYSYSFNYTYTLNCVNNVPDNMSSSVIGNGSFDGPGMSTTDSGSATFNIAGLAQSSTAYTINGEYKRTGSFAQKTGNMNHGNRTIDITATNVMVTKSSGIIASGKASFSLTGTSSNGSFNFTGTITFIGNNQANLVVNGTTYLVNLVNGNCDRQ